MAIALMRDGKRIGVTSLSHKAIHNLLRAIEHEAERQGFAFRGASAATRTRRTPASTVDGSRRPKDSDACADPAFDLVAGTAWALTRDSTDLHVGRTADRRALRRRGRPARARGRARGRHVRALARPARRPEPAPAGLAGLAPGGLRALGAPAPARRGRHRAAGPRAVPRRRPTACGPSSARSPPTRTTRVASATRRGRAAVARGRGTGRSGARSRTRAAGSRRSRRRTRSRRTVRALVGTAFTDVDGSERPLTVATCSSSPRTTPRSGRCARASRRRSPSGPSTSSRASRRPS